MTEIVQPINSTQKALVLQATLDHIGRAEAVFGRKFMDIPVHFDLKGKAAGMYVKKQSLRRIRFNPWIFAKFFEANLRDTVPHEVAHYIVDVLYPGGKIKPHGNEWKQTMVRLGADPVRTCDFDLSGIPIRAHRRFDYHCACRTHSLSTKMHNWICRGLRIYLCKFCRQPLSMKHA